MMNRVAIVGSPNVGKSSLFNRLIGERKAITDDVPGLTRDRIYGHAEWLTVPFTIIDTGGIEIDHKPFQEQIRFQAEIAIEQADVIIYVVDGRRGVTNDDRFVAQKLYRSKKPIILAVNKIDDGQLVNDINDFYALGLGDPLPISAIHGIGLGDLLDKVIACLPKQIEASEKDATIQVAFIGRPNVGKSSLVNALLNEERVIVSPIEGTTRDAIDTPFTWQDQNFILIDTAGLKKRGSIFESIDKYAALRSMRAIDRSDISVILIDAERGLSEQDKHVAGYAYQANRAMVIVVNKWDLVPKGQRDYPLYVKQLRMQVPFLEFVPILVVSAKDYPETSSLLSTIVKVHTQFSKRIQTSILNDLLVDAQLMNQTPNFNGGRLRIYYGEQVSVKPPTFVLFVNDPHFMHFSYLRYLENQIRETFDFTGTPLKIILRLKT
jgi:GTP-binding protein